MIRIGLEELLASPPKEFQGKRLALLANQASTDHGFRHSRDLVNGSFPGQLSCLFSPQHGFFSEKQDNMIESDHWEDPASGLPVFSLYGEVRKPTAEMCDRFDVLLVDLVDVGTRVYTFFSTVLLCMEAASAHNKKVVILDRPNPLGGEETEGNVLDHGMRSFVGLFPIPMRHGMTLGELALMANREMDIGCDLEVIPMRGWRRSMLFPETGRRWVFPSPNMPAFATALVYPGQVIWEGTNVSEGRGTSLPFELCGAPFFEHEPLLRELDSARLEGVILRPILFEPTSNKWAGTPCAGFHLHVIDPKGFRPYRTSLALLQAVMRLYPESFALKEPPYEYDYERMPLDLILGDNTLRERLAQGTPIADLEREWQEGLDRFREARRPYLLYQ